MAGRATSFSVAAETSQTGSSFASAEQLVVETRRESGEAAAPNMIKYNYSKTLL